MGGDIYRIISKLSLISNYRPKLQSLLTDPLKPQSLFTVYIDRLKLQSLLTDFLKDYSLQDAETMSDDSLPPLKHLEANRYSNFYSVMFAYFLKAQDKQCQKLNYVEIQHESQDKKDSENVEYPKNINEISPSILNNRESENEPLLENYDTNQTSENIKTQVPNQDQIVNNTESESVAEDNRQSENVPLLVNYNTNQMSKNKKKKKNKNKKINQKDEKKSEVNSQFTKQNITPTPQDNKNQSLMPTKTTPYVRPPSLTNLGANCYLNSALQGVSSCVKFTEELNEISKQYATPKLEILNHLIGQLSGKLANRGSYEISRNPIFREWNKPGQQDSYELLSYMINQVYQEIRTKLSERDNNYGLNQWLKEALPMRIILKYYMKCKCGPIETPFQVDLAFHVPLCGYKNLDELIENFFDKDVVEGFDCDNCADSQVTRQIKLIKPLPNTLCVHLQRSRWNGRIMEKIDSKITFTETLNIKRRYLLVQTEQKEDDNETDVKHENEVNKDADINPILLHCEHSEENKNNSYKCDNNKANNMEYQNEYKDKTTNLDFAHQKAENGKYAANFGETYIENVNIRTDPVLSDAETNNENKNTAVEDTDNGNVNIRTDPVLSDAETNNENKNTAVGETDNGNVDKGTDPVLSDAETNNENKNTAVGETVNGNVNKSTDPVFSEPETDNENKKSNVGESKNITVNQVSSEQIADSGNKDANDKDKENEADDKHIDQGSPEHSNEHKDDDIIQTYSLSSVIVHYGGVYGGHYVCYKKSGGVWYLTNDSWINKTTWKEVENCNPYILFYEKL